MTKHHQSGDIVQLKPLRAEDYDRVQAFLDRPQLSKRHLYSGIHELHPTEWNRTRKTFVVWREAEVLGTMELHADEDEPNNWELNVTLEDMDQSLDGARCAIAGLFYAFEVLGAEAVWFWNERVNSGVHRFADRMGFIKLNELIVPGGGAADVFELDEDGWETRAVNRFERYLGSPVEISDKSGAWRGEGPAFFVIEER